MRQVFYGTIDNQRAERVIRRVFSLCDDACNVIFRCIDSTSDAKLVSQMVERMCVPYTSITGYPIIGCRTFGELFNKSFLTGFDEIWICDRVPPRLEWNAVPPLTSDACNFDIGFDHRIAEAMAELGVFVVLGTGDWINIATSDKAVATACGLIRCSC